MVTPAAKREAVAHLRSAFEMSERRACGVADCIRMTVRYRSRRADDVQLRTRLRTLAHVRRRFGYRQVHIGVGSKLGADLQPSVLKVGAHDLSVNPACTHAAGAIVMLFRHVRIRMVEQCAGEVGGIPSVRCRGRGGGSTE
jgi:hypothetical protein